MKYEGKIGGFETWSDESIPDGTVYLLGKGWRGMIKDSGKRMVFKGGMVRDTGEDKLRYNLVLDGPMFDRWARLLQDGAKKYAKRNWMKAAGKDELERFEESALTHFIKWLRGEVDEDHAAAVFFNINGAEYVKGTEKAVKNEDPVQTVTVNGTSFMDRRHPLSLKDRRVFINNLLAETNGYRREYDGRRKDDDSIR